MSSKVANHVTLPTYKHLLWPTLRAVREMGDSGTIQEIVERVVDQQGFSEQQQAVQHTANGRTSEIEYRLAWARSYLKGIGALENSKRGVWSTTETGRSMTADDVMKRHGEYRAHLREVRRSKQPGPIGDVSDDDEAEPQDWKVGFSKGSSPWRQTNSSVSRDASCAKLASSRPR